MDYERIILELLGRIQTLEDQVRVLMEQNENKKGEKEGKMSTDEIRAYIDQLKFNARSNGKKTLVLKSGDIHKDLNLKSAMPQVCNAMYDRMETGDNVLHTTPSGFSSTITIEYKL